MPTRDDFARACEGMIGAPLAHRGRSLAGVDCVGVIVVGLNSLGVRVDEPESYGVLPDAALLEQYMSRNFRRIEFESRERGDVLQVRYGKQGRHVAVISRREDDGDVVISAIAKRRKVGRTVRAASQVVNVWRVL